MRSHVCARPRGTSVGQPDGQGGARSLLAARTCSLSPPPTHAHPLSPACCARSRAVPLLAPMPSFGSAVCHLWFSLPAIRASRRPLARYCDGKPSSFAGPCTVNGWDFRCATSCFTRFCTVFQWLSKNYLCFGVVEKGKGRRQRLGLPVRCYVLLRCLPVPLPVLHVCLQSSAGASVCCLRSGNSSNLPV